MFHTLYKVSKLHFILFHALCKVCIMCESGWLFTEDSFKVVVIAGPLWYLFWIAWSTARLFLSQVYSFWYSQPHSVVLLLVCVRPCLIFRWVWLADPKDSFKKAAKKVLYDSGLKLHDPLLISISYFLHTDLGSHTQLFCSFL